MGVCSSDNTAKELNITISWILALVVELNTKIKGLDFLMVNSNTFKIYLPNKHLPVEIQQEKY